MESNNRKDRNTLKAYFKKGETPTEDQFAALIDSMTNVVEDGLPAKTDTGWAFRPGRDGGLDITLYTEKYDADAEPPAWTISVTPDRRLLVRNAGGETVWEATGDKSVSVHGSLTVDDEITAAAYRTKSGEDESASSRDDYVTIPADKLWHDLPIELSGQGFGCRVYHIYASFRERGIGLCGLTRVTAVWLNRLEQRIESPQKHWWGWSGNVCFRWEENSSKPCLQMRSKKKVLSGEVHCRVVKMYEG